MSSTNKTTNLELSQFIGSDKPQWLVDYNGDMSKIDAGVANVKAQADATDLTVASHTSSIANLTQASSDQGTAITALRTDVDGNTGSINTINSLIGNGEPTTTDKTLIGAINELKEDIDAIAPSGDVKADDVTYDNTSSGLAATDVQAAIDEVYAAIPSVVTPTASSVSYSNTASGLTANNVQAAIDELAASSGPTLLATISHTVNNQETESFTLPAGASEIYVECQTGTYIVTTTALIALLPNTIDANQPSRGGSVYFSSSDFVTFTCKLSKAGIEIRFVKVDNNYSAATFYVYAK